MDRPQTQHNTHESSLSSIKPLFIGICMKPVPWVGHMITCGGILALGSIDRLIMTIIAQQTNDRSTIASGSASKTSLEVWTFMMLMLANKLDIFSYGHLTRRMGEGSCFPHNPHPERRRRHTLPIRILADWHAIHIRFEYTM